MFSGTPDRPRATRHSRRESRSVSVAQSVQSQATQRQPTPPSRGAALSYAHARNVSASPAPGLAGNGAGKRGKSVAAMSDVESVMDVDLLDKCGVGTGGGARQAEDADKVLVKDENYVVLERKGLPTEVEQLLSRADPYTDPIRASLDSLTGFAYLISRNGCYVWNWNRRSSSATAYLFPLPPSTSLPSSVSIYSPLSFASFVPISSSTQSQREPGLLIVSTTGDIRYWESVSMALSGVDRWKTATSNLGEGELVRGLTMLSPATFLISTSHSRVLLVSISSSGGGVSGVSVRALDRAVGWAGSVWSAVFGGKASDPRAGILALAVSPRTSSADQERLAYAVTDKDVQVWRISASDDGIARLAVEQDLFAGVLEALKGEKVGNEEWALNADKVEIVDVKVASNRTLMILVSHVVPETAQNAQSFAIVLLEVGTTLISVKAIGARRLSYQSHPDPRPLSNPQLSVSGSELAFVVFPDAVAMISMAPHSSFEEVFSLRSTANRFLGTSEPSSTSPTANLTLLTSNASLLSIATTSTQPYLAFEPGSDEAKTRKLKSKIEQAIFFGGTDLDNPLAFDLLPDFEGDLITAAEAVSGELLSSSSPNLPQILDLRAQLADRISRARALIEYINSNGLIGKLSQSSRYRLSWDAEKLASAAALWHYHNSRIGEGESLLAIAVVNYLTEIGEGFVEDPVRTLFRMQASAIGKVLQHITSRAKLVLGSNAPSDVKALTLQEANHLVLLVFNVISRHRHDSSRLYGLNPDVLPLEAWSSKPGVLEDLQWHFITTDGVLRERGHDHGSAIDEEQTKYTGRPRTTTADTWSQQEIQTELKNLTSLADYVFTMFEERLTYLKTVAVDGTLAAELRVIKDRYVALQPRFIKMLVSRGRVNQAYDLAERHGDFRSLVELCIDPEHGSPARVRLFMQRYTDKFAFELYALYVELGQISALLNQDEEYQSLLTQFLESTNHPQISWLNDLAIGKFAAAAETLVGQAWEEKEVAQKKLLLSIGKLAQVAQTTHENITSEPVQRAIEYVDDDIDMVNLQQELHEIYKQSLSLSEMRLPPQEQARLVTTRLAPSLAEKPAFFQLHVKLCAELLQGHTLSAEDLIDILAFKETGNRPDVDDFTSALEILLRAKNLPEGRKTIALQNIWRRVYLRDDWAELRRSTNLRDEEVAGHLTNTALYHCLSSASTAELPPSMHLPPLASLSTVTTEQLSARFEDLPSHSISQILNDFEAENTELRTLVQDSLLEQYVEEVERLQAVAEEQGTMIE